MALLNWYMVFYSSPSFALSDGQRAHPPFPETPLAPGTSTNINTFAIQKDRWVRNPTRTSEVLMKRRQPSPDVSARPARTSAPGLPGDRFLSSDDDVVQVERGICLGTVRALVCAPALRSRERASRDQAGERMRVAEQPLEALRS